MKVYKYSRFFPSVFPFIDHWLRFLKTVQVYSNVIQMGDRRGPNDALKRIKDRHYFTKKWKQKQLADKERMERNKEITAKMKPKGN